MKKWIMTPLLGGLLLCGTWSSARQNDPPAASPAVQVGGAAGAIDDGPVTATITGGEMLVPPGVALPPPGPGALPPVDSASTPPLPAPGPGMPGVQGFIRRGPCAGVGRSSATTDADSRHRDAVPARQRWRVDVFRSRDWGGKAEKTAFLGVVTARADATLRSQLKLKAGLVVAVVEPKSSADAAGLQVHDIIEKCDEQWLINPAQFIGLVRMYYKPGDKVTLTVIREGQRKKITAKLEERETYAVDDDGNAFYLQQGFFDPDNPEGPVSLRGWSASGTPGPVQRITTAALGTAPLAPGFVATYGNDKGQFLLTIRDGHQILTAKDVKGKQIFQGLIDTPEQRKLVPPDVRRELEEMEKIRENVREKVRNKVHEGVQEAIRKAMEGDGPAPREAAAKRGVIRKRYWPNSGFAAGHGPSWPCPIVFHFGCNSIAGGLEISAVELQVASIVRTSPSLIESRPCELSQSAPKSPEWSAKPPSGRSSSAWKMVTAFLSVTQRTSPLIPRTGR